MHLKKNHDRNIAHQCAHLRLHRRPHLYIVVVIDVRQALSMILTPEGCVVDMDRAGVRQVNVVEKDHANIQALVIREDIHVLVPIKHAEHQQEML